jgi:hypothetical protein
MRCLGGRPEWSRHAIVLRLGPELDRVEVPSLDELLSPSDRHGIPPELFARLDFAGQPDVDA